MKNKFLEVKYGVDYANFVNGYDHIIVDFDNTLALTEIRKKRVFCRFFESAGIPIDTDFLNIIMNETRQNIISKYSQYFKDESEALTSLSHKMFNMYYSVEILECNKNFISQRNVIVVTAGKKVEIINCLNSNKVDKEVKIFESGSKNKCSLYKSLNLHGSIVAIGDSLSDQMSAQSMSWDFIKVVV